MLEFYPGDMFRTALSLTLALALLGGSLLPGAGAAANRPTTGGVSMNVRAIQDARPVLELMVTVKVLADLLERGTIAPEAQALRHLKLLFQPLSGTKILKAADASALETALDQQLSPSEALALKQARSALEARTQALMARARFATPDGPVNLTLIRYGLMVPGGQPMVKQVLGAEVNPYGQPGTNARVLERLLGLLDSGGR